ncbi:MAG: TRAP transporter substrate-binding protein DctP [Deltaproteobacteria bacterium]
MTRSILLLPLLSLALAAPAHAADGDKIVVKAGTVAPDGTPWSELLKRMKRRFKKDSDKRIKLKSYLGGRLGGEKEMLRETREGRIHLWGGSTAAMATMVPELSVLEAPFLFDDDKEADFVLERVRPHVKALLEKQGFVFYQYSENGWHGLALKETCVKTMDDLKGRKIRSQESKIHLDTFKALGANPVEMAVPEVLPALKQGVVDGFSNTPLFSFATSWYQGVGHFTDTNHIYQPAVLVYSKKWFDKQPKEVQKVLLDGVEDDEKFGRNGIRAIRQGLMDNFTKSKIEVCTPSPALVAEMKKATSNIFDDYEKKSTKAGKALFKAIRDAKAAYKKK